MMWSAANFSPDLFCRPPSPDWEDFIEPPVKFSIRMTDNRPHFPASASGTPLSPSGSAFIGVAVGMQKLTARPPNQH